jgi:hypothetical protein
MIKHSPLYNQKTYRDRKKDIQKEILDKVRAEIVELRSKQNIGVLECLDIIDKYRAEVRTK